MGKNKIWALLLIVALLTGMLAACGRGTETDASASTKPVVDKAEASGNAEAEPSDEPEDEPEAEPSDEPEDEPEEAEVFGEGEELTAFVNTYLEAKRGPMDKMTESLNESEDLTLMMSMMGVSMVDLTIAFVPLFDVVDETGMVMMLNLQNAYRKESGGVITFGCDFVREEDSGNDLEGDHEVWDGKLDVKDESLSVIFSTERDGKMVDKTVVEVTKNKDGSYTSQTLSYTADDGDGGVTNGYFIQFEDENMDVVSGNIIGGKPDFSYTSVFKTRNVDIGDLAAGFDVTMDISYKDGAVVDNLKQ